MAPKLVAPSKALYKLLGPNGSPCNGGAGVWPLPNGKPGAWLKVEGKIIACENGLHLCRAANLLRDWTGPELYVAEPRARTATVKQRDKIVVREARLLWRVESWNDQTLRLFAADCAELALKRANVEHRRCWEAVTVARRSAFGLIDDAARAAAGAAAGDAAWAAAGAAARAAARDAAWAAAGAAAGDAAWAAAWAAAWDAAGEWQTKRLLAYLNGQVDLQAIKRSVTP